MTVSGWVTIFAFVLILTALAIPLGRYMAAVYTGERTFLDPIMRYPERFLYRIFNVDPRRGQDWKSYAKSLIIFSFVGWLALYFILRTQNLWSFTGLNPMGFHSMPWNVSFSTASSFLTNTNWQYYAGEAALSYFSQMVGLTVQNFASAAVGIVVAVALIRGIVKHVVNQDAPDAGHLGNFWQDLVRTILYILLPISFVVAIVLVWQGSIQNFSHYLSFTGITHIGQTIAMGPGRLAGVDQAARHQRWRLLQRQLGAPVREPDGVHELRRDADGVDHPGGTGVHLRSHGRQPPSGLRDLRDDDVDVPRRRGVCYIAEAHGSPAQHAAGLHTGVVAGSSGGNLEGKEQRFGIAGSALFNVVTTVTSCGAVNSAMESFTGIGGAVPFANLSASEVIFGGVGTGLYSILLYVLLAVFIGGLMVGRTPEYIGKKIEAREIKLVALGILITPLAALFSTALATASSAGRASIDTAVTGSGPQGFSETFYAYLSQANNNGSAFAGYTGYDGNVGNVAGAHGITFADLLGGFTMLFARYAPILFALAVAGALVNKRVSPAGLGTMRTDNPTFVVLLIGVIILVGALTFFPALLLGPIVQGLTGHLY